MRTRNRPDWEDAPVKSEGVKIETRNRRQTLSNDGTATPTKEISPTRSKRLRGIGKQKDKRMELITRALKGWNDEPHKLFLIDTWKELIRKDDGKRPRSEERITSTAKAIIEQIASDGYAKQISQIITPVKRNRNGEGGDRSTAFLLLCDDFQTNQSNKTWKKAVGEYEEEDSTEDEVEELRTPTIDLKTEDRTPVRVLEYEVEGEKENAIHNKRQTRGLSKAQQLPLGIKSSQSLESVSVIRSNANLPQNSKAKQQSVATATIPPLVNGNGSTVFKSDLEFRPVVDESLEIKRSSPALFMLGPDDEVIENETPPPTPINGIEIADIPIPRKRTRFNSRDLDKTPFLSNRRIRSDSMKMYGDIDDSARGSRGLENGFDYEALRGGTSGGNYTSSRDYSNDDLPDLLEAPDTGRDKENSPKSEQEIIRDYPKPPNGPELRPYMFDDIDEALSRPRKDKIVCSFGLTLRQEQLAVYNKAEWLEDANIDFYLEMIKDRNNKSGGGYPKVYIFQSYFYKLLEKRGYESVQGATGKDNLFEYDLVLIPIHSDHHWVLVVVDFREKTMMCYDSMDHDNEKHLRIIAGFLKRHWKEVEKDVIKSNREITNPPFTNVDDTDEYSYLGEDWRLRNLGAEDIPQQKNGRDCGIFCLQFAEYLSRRQQFDFEQKHTAYFRKRMLYETLKKTLLIS